MPEPDAIARARVTRRHALWLWMLAAMILIPTTSRADDPFQLRYTVERGGAGPARVQGTIVNEGRSDVYDVYVTVEAVDAAGKIIGRGIAFVGSISQRGSAAFSAGIPAAQSAASFRARVTSFRYGGGV